MSGWHQSGNYIFFAYGKCGSTSLDHLHFNNVIRDYDPDCELINNYLQDKNLNPVIFIREPMDRFFSGMFQFVHAYSKRLNIQIPDTEKAWINVWEVILELLNFDKGYPIFNDAESYHLQHYLKNLKNIQKDFAVVDTRHLTPYIKNVLGINAPNMLNSADRYSSDEYKIYKHQFRTSFYKNKYKDIVINWIQPEIDEYQKLLVEKG